MKRLLVLCLLLFATPLLAQDIRPSAYLGQAGKVTVRSGKVLGSTGGVTTIAEQTITPANSATTYIYIDLSSTPAVATSTSGFPSSNYFPICTVIKDANGIITSFTDSRPDFFMAGSGSGSTNSAPNMAFYLSNNCNQSNLNQCIYTTADVQQFNDCSWTNASTTITCNTAHFGVGQALVNPVGMSVMGFKTCADDVTSAHASGGEIAPNAAMPTVLSVTDSTHIVISATPANTQALVSTFPVGGCVIIGHIDDTAAATMWTAIAAAPQCSKVFLAASNYLFTKPPQFLWDNPTACQNMGPALGGPLGNPGFGTTTLSAGFEVEGRGAGPTTLYLATNFPNGDTCAHKPTPAVSLAPFQNGGACFAMAVMGKWSDFRIDGGGQGAPTALNGKTLGPYMAVGTLMNYTCTNYGAYEGGNAAGIELSLNNSLYQVNNSGCGALGIVVDVGATNSVGMRVVVESSGLDALYVGAGGGNGSYSWTCYWCDFAFADSQPFGAFPVVANNGGSIKLFGGYIYLSNGNEGGNTNNGEISYQCQNTAGCKLYAEGVSFGDSGGGGSNTNGGIKCSVACTNYLINDQMVSQASGFDIQDVAGSNTYDLGGNTTTSPPRMSISGNVIGDASIAGTAITSAKLVLSAGWGTTAAWTSLIGQTRRVQGTITASGTGQSANPTITYTFPNPFWSTSNLTCSATQIGGTQAAIANPFVPSALTATGVTFTYQGTPTAGNTFVVLIDCGVK